MEEIELQLKLTSTIPRHPRTLLSFFDDSGGVVLDKGYYVIKIDGFAASRALYPWCSLRDFGFRAITAAVSDVLSKGCRPLIYAVSIGVKNEHWKTGVEDIIKGVVEAIKYYGGYIENIDTNAGNDDWIDVFVLGECRYKPISREIQPNNCVENLELVLIDQIGLSVDALYHYAILKRRPKNFETIEFSCRPKINYGFIHVFENYRSYIAASIDISDTLYETLHTLATINNMGLYLDVEPEDVLLPSIIDSYRHTMDLFDTVLACNEEYKPIVLIDKTVVWEFIDELHRYGFKPSILGRPLRYTTEIIWRGRSTKRIIWSHVSSSLIITDKTKNR